MHGKKTANDRDEFNPRSHWTISTVFASVFWLIEYGPGAFARLCGRLFSAIGLLQIGVFIVATGRVLTDFVGRMAFVTHHFFLRIVYSKVSESLVKLLTHGYFFVRKTASLVEVKIAEAVERSIILKAILTPAIACYFVCKSVVFFGGNWVYTRSVRNLFLAIPAVVLLIPLVVCLIQIPFLDAEAKTRSYELAIWHAIENEEFELANFYYRKLYQLRKHPKDETVYRSAITLDAEGKTEAAIQQMETISQPDKPGFAPGHSWIAAKKIKEYLGVRIPSTEQDRIRQHLHHALTQNPTDVRSAILLSRLQLESGDRLASHQTLSKHAENSTHVITSAEISSIFAQLGDHRSAKRYSNDTLRRLGNRKDAKTNHLSELEFIAWARAMESLGKFDEAFSILKRAIVVHPEDPSILAAATTAGLYLDTVYSRSNVESSKRFALLESLVSIAPENDELMTRIGRIAMDKSHTLCEQANDLLQTAIDEHNSSVAHKTLATSAIKSNNQSEARRHFEQQVQINSNDSDACNNLAWMLAHSEPIDLPNAIHWIEKAIAISPTNPHYHDTHGQILIKMNRFQDAVRALELALNGMPNNPATHSALSSCYRKLGKDDLAAAHQRLSENR